MVADLYPAAAWTPVSYASQAAPFPAPPRGWVLHVTVMNGSPWSVFDTAVSPDRRFSHLWVSKTGRVEQYGVLSREAWHVANGNPGWWGVETEGFPGEPLTAAQVDALAHWHVWCGAPDSVATSPDGVGISAHYLGGPDWGGHSCPDPDPGGQGPRSHQRAAIVARAQQLRGGDMPLTEAEWTRMSALLDSKAATYADAVENRYGVKLADGTIVNRDVEEATIDAMLRQVLAKVSVGTGGPVDVQALATALAPVLSKAEADELARRLTS